MILLLISGKAGTCAAWYCWWPIRKRRILKIKTNCKHFRKQDYWASILQQEWDKLDGFLGRNSKDLQGNVLSEENWASSFSFRDVSGRSWGETFRNGRISDGSRRWCNPPFHGLLGSLSTGKLPTLLLLHDVQIKLFKSGKLARFQARGHRVPGGRCQGALLQSQGKDKAPYGIKYGYMYGNRGVWCPRRGFLDLSGPSIHGWLPLLICAPEAGFGSSPGPGWGPSGEPSVAIQVIFRRKKQRLFFFPLCSKRRRPSLWRKLRSFFPPFLTFFCPKFPPVF